ncbi:MULTISPECIES: BREX-1 system adenine-specific DNA-methyltransferase PglX [Pseudomonas]|uniref:BREX-1 system adenine-specific DNA-methyltransferase PglX n=1 Tax=Pseudomonas TaxID=286 RepID=UPI001F35A2D4|nr:BREX-1 system adenine-specific DNA-methyltransferase PglX [Pseudomonas fulva]
MTTFLRLLADKEKAANLLACCTALRAETRDERVFKVAPESFRSVPGAPFAYWVSDPVRQLFKIVPALESDLRTTKQGLATADDFRFVQVWWEGKRKGWFGFAKGGAFSPFYSDVYLQVNWSQGGEEIKNNLNDKGGVRSNVWMLRDTASNCFGRPGLTWPRRTQGGLSLRAMPQGCIFADKGPAMFVADDVPNTLLALLALVNSRAFGLLVSLQMAFGSYEVGVIQRTPVPDLSVDQQRVLANLARRAWSLKRTLDTTNEVSHAFVLPVALRTRLGDYDPSAFEAELSRIQIEIDDIAFELYGFSGDDRAAALGGTSAEASVDECHDDYEGDDEETRDDAPSADALLSWAVGVAFGRFDWRLATGERTSSPEPQPFDPLPAKSPGMLPDGAMPFHRHPGILVDDLGHLHDLARLVERVLETVESHVTQDVRRWLQKDFFAFHLKRYSKSRRKAPIYWPLSTASGSYTLWFYYPSLSDQTLFTAVNDFVDPKLDDVRKELQLLHDKGASRSKQDETSLEALASLEHELADLRDSLLEIAPSYRPNHDDGVQITAAPLWKLFRLKSWQKVLKDTWVKLEKGDYDWAHLAMNYWPDRVRDKCVTDKSLAIAHGLEHLYVEPEPVEKKTRGRKKAGSTE